MKITAATVLGMAAVTHAFVPTSSPAARLSATSRSGPQVSMISQLSDAEVNTHVANCTLVYTRGAWSHVQVGLERTHADPFRGCMYRDGAE